MKSNAEILGLQPLASSNCNHITVAPLKVVSGLQSASYKVLSLRLTNLPHRNGVFPSNILSHHGVCNVGLQEFSRVHSAQFSNGDFLNR